MDSIIPLGQKNTLAEYMILSGADNRPPMLKKDLYDSWKNRMELYMQNIKHGRMILESVEHSPLIWPTIEKNRETRKKKYAELFAAEKIKADCDMKTTNIILQGLPSDVYALVNHHRVDKDLWERVQLLMQGTSLTKQERECKLYDAFDKFAYIKGESLHQYYLRFSQLINDMNIYNMRLEQFQVNTKFLNSLPPEWSKFVTDVKLIKDLHTTNFDQLHAHLQQHELHANEVRLMRKRNQDPFALVANHQMTPPHNNTYQSSYNNPHLQQHISSAPQVVFPSPQVSTQPMNESPPVDSGFTVSVFSPGDDPIACLNKAMAFLTAVASLRFPTTNNQLRTSSNLRNHATIQDGRVIVQQVQGRQGQSYSSIGYKSIATSSEGNNVNRQIREKAMLAEAQEAGQILDEEQLTFLADPGIPDGQVVQTIIPNNAAFQTEDLDTYDSDCDDISNAKAVLMANISNFGSNIVTENQNAPEILKYFENNNVKAQLQDKEATICKMKEIIKSLREKSKEENVIYDNCEIATKKVELENSVAKLLSENECLCKEINHVKQIFKDQFDSIKKTRVHTKEQSDSLIDKLNLKSAENEDLKAQIQDKVSVITSLKNNLRKLKGKEIIDLSAQIPSATTIVPGMFELDLEPLAHKLLRNREDHMDYLRYTQEQADILREIVELAKAKHPLDSELNNAYSNTHVLSSTRVKCSTSNCGLKPTSNTKNDRISQSPSRNKKNKVEAQPRNVNKKNRVVEPIHDVDVKHSLINANSEPIYATCKKSMFDGVHDMCVIDFVKNVVQIVLWYPDFGCSKHMIGNRSQLMNFVSRFLGTVRFGNDQIAKIMGYGDYQLGKKNTCFIRNLEGVDLLSGSRDTNLYTISLDDMLKTSPICLLSKALKTKSWLWHRRLSHLNFGTLNKLAKDGLARGIPKLKFQKDHLCSACALGKSKKSSHKPKAEDTNQEKLYLLHMDLCGPMHVASSNGKRYILVIIDDYSRFTWVRFLRSKDEAPEAIIKCIKNIQVRLNSTVRNVRTDNGTEFVNQTLREFYENVGISHQTSVARTPQQNNVVERRNRTLVEASRTMLIFSKALLFL
ncbi:retrovirus-related pol polyprotein from transposon TNT 1-94 [Tanacetum coccineum]